MTWEILPINQFSAQARHWDTLLRSAIGVPFLESAFLQPLLQEFGTGKERLAMYRSDGQLRAAAILTKMRPGTWQTFQPSQLPLGAWISGADADLPQLGRDLIKALPGFCLELGLTQLDPFLLPRPSDTPGVSTLDYIQTAWIDIDQPFDAYWESRGKNLKSNVRKQRSKLQTEGTACSLECIDSPKGMAEGIRDYGNLESTGWKAKDGTAVHPDNAQGRFYRKALEGLSAEAKARVYRYRFGDKIVAMDLCVESGERIVILKTAYDEAIKSISPSTLMRQDQVRELFDAGKIKRIEFYGRIMEWHTRWTDNARTLYHLTVYRWPLLQYLHQRFRKPTAVAEDPQT